MRWVYKPLVVVYRRFKGFSSRSKMFYISNLHNNHKKKRYNPPEHRKAISKLLEMFKVTSLRAFCKILALLSGLWWFMWVFDGLRPFKQFPGPLIYLYYTVIIFSRAWNARTPPRVVCSVSEVKKGLSEGQKCHF